MSAKPRHRITCFVAPVAASCSYYRVLQRVAVCCRVLQCVSHATDPLAWWCLLQLLQCVAVCCSVLQCVAVCQPPHRKICLVAPVLRINIIEKCTHSVLIMITIQYASLDRVEDTLQHTATHCNTLQHSPRNIAWWRLYLR